MPLIHKLDTQLINQIAAGEVVERPVSVVKELIENSLDAGATRIRINLEAGGTKLIEVSDNGSGIAREDFPLVFEKHATSKISNLQDLQNVLSFGFRGEALASISSVSETTLFSRQRGNIEGYSISSENSEIQVVSCEEGTKIRVENLFANTPARLNYLKTERTEYHKIVEFVQAMALAYPEVSFEILSDGKRVWYFAEGEDLKTRVYQIYGQEFTDNIIPIAADTGTLKISGVMSAPTVSFGNKNKQVLFVNKRLIHSPAIFRAASDAYNRYIAPKTFSGYVLSIEIDPTVVDVNVHPRKMELRFADESNVFRSVYHVITQNLEKVSLAPVPESISSESQTEQREQFYTGSGNKFKNYSPYTEHKENPSQSRISDALSFSEAVLGDKSGFTEIQDDRRENFDLHETPLGRIIAQVHRSYILVETPTGMQLFDQHALAERVIFEKLRRNAKTPKIQAFLVPEMIQLTPGEHSVLENNIQAFESLGFSFDFLSNGLISLSSIPDVMKKSHITETFKSIVDDIKSEIGKSKTLDEIQNRLWAYTACRSAIKFGDTLSLFEMNALLKDAVSDYSSTCPHGRPVIWEVSLEELKKKYER